MTWLSRQKGTTCAKPMSHCMTRLCRHASSSLAGSTTRDKQRAQPGADTTTGNQTLILEPPDLTPHMNFNMNVLEHVAIPDVAMEKRRCSELAREKVMRVRFGPQGPGEPIHKNPQQVRRDMLQEQQDIDGLPWEVRWRRTLIPTSEEIVQDIKDRFTLFEQDPMDREQEWYLHWKDRAFRVQRDRRIWPQGYTDYLDHYDEHGRRRVLPSDQRWSDTSWRYLADVHYKDRMWLLEGESRKAAHASLCSWEAVLQEEDHRQSEMGDTFHGLLGGVVDLDPEQTYQALSGTANPAEVAKTKLQVQSYAAEQMIKQTQPILADGTSVRVPHTHETHRCALSEHVVVQGECQQDDCNKSRILTHTPRAETHESRVASFHASGISLPPADAPRLASGVTVEQAALIVGQTAMENEKLEQLAESARQSGRDPTAAYMHACTAASMACGNQPVLRVHAEARMRALCDADSSAASDDALPLADCRHAVLPSHTMHNTPTECDAHDTHRRDDGVGAAGVTKSVASEPTDTRPTALHRLIHHVEQSLCLSQTEGRRDAPHVCTRHETHTHYSSPSCNEAEEAAGGDGTRWSSACASRVDGETVTEAKTHDVRMAHVHTMSNSNNSSSSSRDSCSTQPQAPHPFHQSNIHLKESPDHLRHIHVYPQDTAHDGVHVQPAQPTPARENTTKDHNARAVCSSHDDKHEPPLSAPVTPASRRVRQDGFLPIPPRPPGSDAPHLFSEVYNPPSMTAVDAAADEALPAWYRAALVDTEPLIRRYGMTQDPLEMQDNSTPSSTMNANNYMQPPPPPAPDDRITADDAVAGVSAFDEAKLHKLRTLPEMAEGYRPLPLFRDVADEEENNNNNNNNNNKSATTTTTTTTNPMDSNEYTKTNDGTRRCEDHDDAKRMDALPLHEPPPPYTKTKENVCTRLCSSSFSSSSSSSSCPISEASRTPARSTKSTRVRQARLERARQRHDPDILLPALPWEVDSIVDPYRGVARNDAADFDKSRLEQTWQTYRGVFRQALTEFANLSQVTTEEQCERLLRDTMTRFREGHVGAHPAIPHAQEQILRRVFEAHTKHFLGDFYHTSGSRRAESQAIKSEGDELLRQASAQAKQQGPLFMAFVQEMTSRELDAVRQNPVQRHAIMLPNKHYEQLLQPMIKWMGEVLSSHSSSLRPSSHFAGASAAHNNSNNNNHVNEIAEHYVERPEAVELHREWAERELQRARLRCPARLPGLTDAARDAAVESCFQWCRGALSFHTGRRFAEMMLHYADTRLRSRAEMHYENSMEYFINYARIGRGVVHIPVPHAEPDAAPYRESEFIDGESAVQAEMSGQMEKAESIWHSGSFRRWYPLLDETEYMLFLERRGRLTLALEVSERCLGHLQTKTHPSLHPFPERARVFLEGAPATQETVEHVWMRHMGEVCMEHAAMMERQGQFERARRCRARGVGFYALALRSAREQRLPVSWKAPLLTRARYCMAVGACGVGREGRRAMQEEGAHVTEAQTSRRAESRADSTTGAALCATHESHMPAMTEWDNSRHAHDREVLSLLRSHLTAVAEVVEALLMMPEPAHWRDVSMDLPIRLALVQSSLPVYGEYITHMAVQAMQQSCLLNPPTTVPKDNSMHISASKPDHDSNNVNSSSRYINYATTSATKHAPTHAEPTHRAMCAPPSRELLTAHMRQLAEGGAELAEVQPYLRAIHTAAEQIFRQPILRWRSRERVNSDAYLYWTYLYFSFHVRPDSEAEVSRLYELFLPTYEHIYTHCALASPTRGQRLMHSALRYLCHILLPGSVAHKQTLLRTLQQVRDRMSHMADKTELNRTVVALERHLADASQPVYVYSSAMLYAEAVRHEQIARNPLLRSALGAADYAAMRERESRVRQHAHTSSSPPGGQTSGGGGAPAEANLSGYDGGEGCTADALDRRGAGSPSSTRAMFNM